MKLRTWIIIAILFGLFFWKGFLVTFGVVIAAVGIWTIWCVTWDSYRQRRRKECLPDTPITGKGGLLTPEPTKVHRVEAGTGPHDYSAPRSTVDHGLLRVGGPAKLVDGLVKCEKCGFIDKEPTHGRCAQCDADYPTNLHPKAEPTKPCNPPPAAVEEVKKPVEMVPRTPLAPNHPFNTSAYVPRKRCKVVKRRKRTKPALRRTVLGINTFKPGQTCRTSGQYRNSRTRKQCTVSRGEQMPPCPRGTTWRLTDATRHKKVSQSEHNRRKRMKAYFKKGGFTDLHD